MKPYTDWPGCSLNTSAAWGDVQMAINTDLRRLGELRRRPGCENRRSLSGSTALHMQASGRDYLLTFDAGTLGAVRLT